MYVVDYFQEAMKKIVLLGSTVVQLLLYTKIILLCISIPVSRKNMGNLAAIMENAEELAILGKLCLDSHLILNYRLKAICVRNLVLLP